MAIASSSGKNIWVAASDGDLERVKYLVEVQGMSPNAPDENTYTPMHAAASYAHHELLEYLVSKGGNVNVTDEDGDTPLYAVENADTARWLVEHGADAGVKNKEGLSAAEHLFEDHPEAAIYLQQQVNSSSSSSALPTNPITVTSTSIDDSMDESSSSISPFQAETISTALTDDLIAQTGRIMADAQRDGVDPEERLREVVSKAMMDGLRMARPDGTDDAAGGGRGEEPDSKRSRAE